MSRTDEQFYAAVLARSRQLRRQRKKQFRIASTACMLILCVFAVTLTLLPKQRKAPAVIETTPPAPDSTVAATDLTAIELLSPEDETTVLGRYTDSYKLCALERTLPEATETAPNTKEEIKSASQNNDISDIIQQNILLAVYTRQGKTLYWITDNPTLPKEGCITVSPEDAKALLALLETLPADE